ncbi:MAG: SPOR domain-containing protein, partial [Geminicoccaceae bacterium]
REAEAALARLLADVGPAESSAEQPAADQPAVEQSAAPAPDPVVAVPAMRPATVPSSTAPTIVRPDTPQVAATVDAPSREADEALTRLLAEVAGVPVDATPEPQGAPADAPARAVAALAPADDLADTRRTMGPGFRVQVAAVREQDDARRAWANLADRLGALVADYEPFYERAETVNGVFYRIQLGPFASEQTADRLCVEVQRRNASCFVVAR